VGVVIMTLRLPWFITQVALAAPCYSTANLANRHQFEKPAVCKARIMCLH